MNYKIYVFDDNDWDKPKEVFESKITKSVIEKIYGLIDKYANG